MGLMQEPHFLYYVSCMWEILFTETIYLTMSILRMGSRISITRDLVIMQMSDSHSWLNPDLEEVDPVIWA